MKITGIAAGGDGVARLPDGRVVFVPRAAPGDVVELADVRFKRTFGRGTIARIVEASPDRAEPRCRHYAGDDCGGCVMQHLTYPAQLAVKGRFVRDALERIAKADVPPFDVVPNPRPFGWRTRLALSVEPRTGAIGLRRLDRPGEVFDLAACEIASAPIGRAWDVLRAAKELLPPGTSRVTLREDRAGGLHVIVQTGGDWRRAADAGAALEEADVPATLWVQPEGGDARPALAPVMAGAAGDRSPGADASAVTVFEQVDPSMGDLVRSHAIAALGDVLGRDVWDLYAGIGETTAALAAAGATVESVESDPAAVAAAVAATARRRQSQRGQSARVTRHTARVEDVLDRLTAPAAVLANPPRAGLGPAVVDLLLARSPDRIVYVSCDPATLARDVARLAPRFRLAAVRAFDSFPQTAHVEAVATLDAAPSA